MTKLQLKRRGRLGAAALPILLALGATLAACSHSDDNNSTPPVASNPDPTPPVASDSFVTYVMQAVATASDTEEPLSTEGVNVTAPEGTEPIPLPGA